MAQKHLTENIWKAAAEEPLNGGFEEGKPDVTQVIRAYNYFIKNESYEEAKALQTVNINKTWTEERVIQAGLTEEGAEGLCTRCSKEVGDEWRKTWTCEDNKNIRHWAMDESDKLRARAMKETHYPCM